MDIFKLLSRATKPTGKSSATDAQTSKLPSAGSTPNPQLYHDPIPEPRGQKRKRSAEVNDKREASPVDEELNFFARKEESKRSAKKQTVQDAESREQEHADKEHHSAQKTSTMLSESECRQVLRSHRLKVTLLPSRGLQKAPSAKRKKNSKKRKDEDDSRSKSKEEAKQLYPQPLIEFEELQSTYGISRRLKENLALQGYRIPTEAQIGSLPVLLRPDLELGGSICRMYSVVPQTL